MSRSTKKLNIRKETIRLLQNTELAAVHGGVLHIPAGFSDNCWSR